MAFVNTQDDQQSQVAGGTNAPGVQAPPQTASTGAGGATAASSPQGASSVAATTKAPPVQDLHAYLAANAPQAVQAGQNIGNNLSATANKVTGDINADQSAVDAGVQAQNVTPNQSLVNQAASNPSAFVQDPNNVAAFQQQENANYTGPANYESTGNYQGLQNEVTDAVNGAPDINQPGGISQLITGQEKNPTVGKENLDSLLLQENPDALAPIKSALAQYPQLGSYLSNAAQTEDSNINQTISNDQAAPQYVNQQFLTGPNAVAPKFQGDLNSGIQSGATQESNYNNTVNNNIANLNPLNSNFNSFETQAGLTGLNNPLSSYLNQKVMTDSPTFANTATSQQYAEDAALSQLLGKGYSPALDQANIGQAGSFNVPTATAANLQDLSQQVGDVATNGLFSQKVVPQINSFNNRLSGYYAVEGGPNNGAANQQLNGLDNQHFPQDSSKIQSNLADTSPSSQSSFIANQPGSIPQGFWNPVDPNGTGYNSLLQYLASVNPSNVTKGANGNYSVNS